MKIAQAEKMSVRCLEKNVLGSSYASFIFLLGFTILSFASGF